MSYYLVECSRASFRQIYPTPNAQDTLWVLNCLSYRSPCISRISHAPLPAGHHPDHLTRNAKRRETPCLALRVRAHIVVRSTLWLCLVATSRFTHMDGYKRCGAGPSASTALAGAPPIGYTARKLCRIARSQPDLYRGNRLGVLLSVYRPMRVPTRVYTGQSQGVRRT